MLSKGPRDLQPEEFVDRAEQGPTRVAACQGTLAMPSAMLSSVVLTGAALLKSVGKVAEDGAVDDVFST